MGYLAIKEETKDRLHLARAPSLWSYSILAGLVAFGLGAAYYGSDYLIWKVIYVAGATFLGITCLEEWEECVFDRSTGQVKLHKLSLIQKLLQPMVEQPIVVSDIQGIVDVCVEEESVRYFGNGHQVVLKFDTGMSLGITDTCTFGDSSEHAEIARKIRKFLGLEDRSGSGRSGDHNEGYMDEESSSTDDSFEQIDKMDVIEELEKVGDDMPNIPPEHASPEENSVS